MWKGLRERSVLLTAALGFLILAALAAVSIGTAQTESASESTAGPDDPSAELESALATRELSAAARMLDAGVDPAQAIIDATRRRDAEALRWLFARGVVASGRPGARALLVALGGGSPEIVELLRAHGADLDAAEGSGITLLMSMAADQDDRKRSQRVVAALIDQGADVDKRSLAGRSALLLAVKADKAKSVRRLLEAGAEVDARDRDGWTPLMLAARDGRTDLVEDLLAAGADPSALSDTGWTPLMWASWYGHTAVIERLLGAGADPDLASYVGGTALIRAVQAGRPNVVAILLAGGADPGARLFGLDAFGWARVGDQARLLRMLRRAGRG